MKKQINLESIMTSIPILAQRTVPRQLYSGQGPLEANPREAMPKSRDNSMQKEDAQQAWLL